MEYTEAQQDRIEPPNAGQSIPYEDYSVAATTEDEEGDERNATKHSNPPPHHQQKKQHQRRSSRKRSFSSSSSDSSRSSSSSSIMSSSSSSDDSDNARDATPAKKKKKRKKKETATRTGERKRNVGGRRQQPQKAINESTDDGSINKLISVALRSQKKQYKNQIIQSVKSDLMNTLRSRIVQHQQRGKKKTVGGGGGGDDEEGTNDDVDATTTDTTTDKQYRKRIKQAYKELEEGYDDAPKFNSKQHKKTIGSILSKLGEVNDIQLYRIPHIDKEMGLDKMDIGGANGGGDTKLNKKMLSASPDKTIPEAVYAALKDAYSSCMLYKYFFRRIYPYLTVPYISK